MARVALVLILTVASLVGQVLGSPVRASPNTVPTPFIFNFDDLTPSVVTTFSPVPVPYHGLNFSAFTIANFSNPLSFAIPPHSPPNVIGASVVTNIRTGPATVSTQYQGSVITKFDLKSVYISCRVQAQGTAAVPQACTLQFTGTTTTGAIVSALGSYKPASLLKVPMQQVMLPSNFVNLKKVEVTVPLAATLPLATSFQFDDFEAVLYR